MDQLTRTVSIAHYGTIDNETHIVILLPDPSVITTQSIMSQPVKYKDTMIISKSHDPIDLSREYALANKVSLFHQLNPNNYDQDTILLRSNLYLSLSQLNFVSTDVVVTPKVSLFLDDNYQLSNPITTVSVVSSASDNWDMILGGMYDSDIAIIPVTSYSSTLDQLLRENMGKFMLVIIVIMGPGGEIQELDSHCNHQIMANADVPQDQQIIPYPDVPQISFRSQLTPPRILLSTVLTPAPKISEIITEPTTLTVPANVPPLNLIATMEGTINYADIIPIMELELDRPLTKQIVSNYVPTLSLINNWVQNQEWIQFEQSDVVDTLFPIIQQELAIEQLRRKSEFIMMVSGAFILIMYYYGLYFDGIDLVTIDPQRLFQNVISGRAEKYNHYMITRMLKFLQIMQMIPAYDALKTLVIKLATQYPALIDESTKVEWMSV